ncbi:MAG: Magnesium chelatase [Pelosinus sp.]|nr:Magnesium chelatase [Pelosinus sp.]
MKSYDQLVRHKGNQDLFKAVEMSVVALHNNMPLHIHAEGLRGTGKTTIMRAVKKILPPIIRIKNCRYNCHPDAPHCPEHRYLSSEGVRKIGTELVPCPFLEISHAAKIGTVVGSIDLGKLTNQKETSAAILPGTLPQAHRGIIFIDEINRLADTSPELADVLLDVMGTKPGHLQIEETGMPVIELPVSVCIWAASNPDEEPGALNRIRRQLADRFDFSINMGRPSDYQAVYTILEKHNKEEIITSDNKKIAAVGSLESIIIEDYIRKIIAKVYVDFNLESLRAVETMEFASSLSCLLAGRNKVEVTDISSIVNLALAHRIDGETIAAILKYLDNIKNECNMEDIAPNCASEKIMEKLVKQEDDEKIAWWRKIIATIYNKVRFSIKSNKQGEYSESGSEALSAGNIVDPTKTTIIAPPQKAVAMKELPVEDFIASEGNIFDDKK